MDQPPQVVGSSGDRRYNGGRLAFRKPLPLHELSVYKRSVGFAKLLTKEMQRHSSISATCMQVVGVCAKTTAKALTWYRSYMLWPLDRVGWESMPKKGITGHDGWVMTEALATALVALEQLPPKHQPHTQMDDIRKLLAAGCQPGTVNLHLAQAKCRLFPDLDRKAIYREYGLEDGQA